MAEIEACDSTRDHAHSEIEAGQFSTLAAYRAARERKGKWDFKSSLGLSAGARSNQRGAVIKHFAISMEKNKTSSAKRTKLLEEL